MRRLPLRARLTLWYSVALLLVLCLFGAVVVWQEGRIGFRRIDNQLDEDQNTLTNLLRDELSEIPDVRGAAADVVHTISTASRAHAILDEHGLELAANWHGLDPAGTRRAADGVQSWTAGTAAGAWRVRVRPEKIGERTFVLLVATPLADVFRERDEAIEALQVGIPIAALLAMAGGWWLASVGLQPITAMARRAEDLPVGGTGDLGESNRADELGRLARAFNGLLARLRQALQTERQFIADASHEFRTPVSVIRSAADVALARDHREESDYREALAITREQARRLTRLVDDMLVLARADAGGYPVRPVAVYLNELVSDCRRTLNVLACERRVRIETPASGDRPFTGDEDLLRRMLLNVMQNAVQHTRAGGAVRVTLSADAAAVTIRVTDEGEGIPGPQQTRIFERFVQLDTARRHAGAGLGLPIARWIAEAHGGRLDLESSDAGGSTFRIDLPLRGAHAP